MKRPSYLAKANEAVGTFPLTKPLEVFQQAMKPETARGHGQREIIIHLLQPSAHLATPDARFLF